MSLHSATSISFDLEPFFGYGDHATDSAYPHSDSPLPVSSCLHHGFYLKLQELQYLRGKGACDDSLTKSLTS